MIPNRVYLHTIQNLQLLSKGTSNLSSAVTNHSPNFKLLGYYPIKLYLIVISYFIVFK